MATLTLNIEIPDSILSAIGVTLDELLSSVTGQEENSLEQIKKMFVEQAVIPTITQIIERKTNEQKENLNNLVYTSLIPQ